jgi:hypothetical protein
MSYIHRLEPVGTVKWEVRGTVVNPGLKCQTLPYWPSRAVSSLPFLVVLIGHRTFSPPMSSTFKMEAMYLYTDETLLFICVLLEKHVQ